MREEHLTLTEGGMNLCQSSVLAQGIQRWHEGVSLLTPLTLQDLMWHSLVVVLAETVFGQSIFGQSIFGHRVLGPANFGQNQFWPIQFGPIHVWPKLVFQWFHNPLGPRRVGGPKIRAFFFLLPLGSRAVV